ncbi:MAG: hypothetical protein LM564_03150 [Desulfurococcaceae archaeon]|nr:hypothetical protein [Desulfurococcaceae archaeon]
MSVRVKGREYPEPVDYPTKVWDETPTVVYSTVYHTITEVLTYYTYYPRTRYVYQTVYQTVPRTVVEPTYVTREVEVEVPVVTRYVKTLVLATRYAPTAVEVPVQTTVGVRVGG